MGIAENTAKKLYWITHEIEAYGYRPRGRIAVRMPKLFFVGVNTQERIGRTPAKGAGHQWNDANRAPPGLKIESGTNNNHPRYHADHPICFAYITLHILSPLKVSPIPIRRN